VQGTGLAAGAAAIRTVRPDLRAVCPIQLVNMRTIVRDIYCIICHDGRTRVTTHGNRAFPKQVAGVLTKCPNVIAATEIDHPLKGSRWGQVRAANRFGPDHGSGRGIEAPQATLTSRGKEPPVFISERRPQALSYQIERPEDRAACGIDGIDL
jgi:hypothetical protein